MRQHKYLYTKSLLGLPFVPELFVELFLYSFKTGLVCLLPLVVVLKFELDGTPNFHVLSDEPQGQLQNLHVVRY